MAFGNATAGSGNSTAPSTAVPSSVAANSIVVVQLSYDGTSELPDSFLPSGFIKLDSKQLTFDGQSAVIGYKRLTGADSGSYSFGTFSSTRQWLAQAYSFDGRDTTNPPVISTINFNDAANPSTISAIANAVTAILGDDLIYFVVLDPDGSQATITTAAPAGFTNRKDSLSSPFPFAYSAGCTLDNASAGSTGSKTGIVTMDTGDAAWIGWLIRIPLLIVSAAPPQLPLLGVG